jgi:hypothetical protein
MYPALRSVRPIRSWLPLLAAFALSITCASTNPNATKYPPRQKHCQVRVFYSAVPEVKEWDDLGMANVDCNLDVGAVQCLARLRQEACRMGGDILYDVPKKALRPTDEGMSFRGHVAHTRRSPEGKDQGENTSGGDEQPDVDAGPVEPIVPLTPFPATTGAGDGGLTGGAAR